MSTTKTTTSTFRFRTYEMPDGSFQEVFGDGPAPDGGVIKSDDTIVQTTTRTANI